MQFENCHVQILQGGKSDLRTSFNLVEMRFEFRLNLVVVDMQTCFFCGPGRGRQQNNQNQSQGTRKDAQSAPLVHQH